MAEVDLPGDAIGTLTPSQLVELLERLDPRSDALEQINIDAIAAAIDPKKLGRAEFVTLLEQVDRLAGAGAADLASIGARTFARLINRASADQLRDVLARPDLRAMVLGEIFRRMQEHLRADRAATVKAVVHWRFTDGSDEDGYDRYETVLDNGVCTTTQAHRHEDPRATITMAPYEFVRLITSNASGPMLYVTGRLKVRGDLPFAAGLTGLFNLPRG